MQHITEIQKEMAMNGYQPKEIIPDGKFHRFDGPQDKPGKKSGYYILHNNHFESHQFIAGIYGDFKSGSRYAAKPGIKLDRFEKERVEEQIKKAQIKADQETRAAQEEVSQKLTAKWETLTHSGSHDYLRKKQISNLMGARVEFSNSFGYVLQVPMRDVNGKLWSYQSIYQSGEKKFRPKGKINGNFHVLGDLKKSEIIYLTEGFATAGSIHMALEKPVVCTFTANNLVNVAKILTEFYPEKSFVICGDDDQWTLNPAGEPWNPGRDKASEAARAIMSIATFPTFLNLDTKPSDYNDLHVLEGLDTVRKQIVQLIPDKVYVEALGYNNQEYYFVSDKNKQIQKFSASSLASATTLMQLQPLVYWENRYPSSGGQAGKPNWQKAADDLIQKGQDRGIFRMDRIRGSGVWLDNGRSIYHAGEKLYLGAKEIDLSKNKLDSKFIYELSETLPSLNKKPYAVEEMRSFFKLCHDLNWRHDTDCLLFMGWLAIAPIAGALSWRPHMWVTGDTGSGKSFIMDRIVNRVLGPYRHPFQGDSSEAGVRQTTKNTSMAVIFDELESNKENKKRVQAILDLAKQASSDTSGFVVKGTVSGDAMQFKPQFAMIASSVRPALVKPEDKNRFTLLELVVGKNNPEQFSEIERLADKISSDFSERFFSRSFGLIDVIQESADIFRDKIALKANMRAGSQYGTIMAGFWSLISSSIPSESEVNWLTSLFDFEKSHHEVVGSVEYLDCLDYLFDKRVRVQEMSGLYRDTTIGSLIRDSNGDLNVLKNLELHGITKKDHILYISTGNRETKDIFKDSDWGSTYATILARAPGAIRKRVHFQEIKGQPWSIAIPYSSFIAE